MIDALNDWGHRAKARFLRTGSTIPDGLGAVACKVGRYQLRRMVYEPTGLSGARYSYRALMFFNLLKNNSNKLD